jgi:hypothetical protein
VSSPKRAAAEVLILVSITNSAATAGAVEYYMEDGLLVFSRLKNMTNLMPETVR